MFHMYLATINDENFWCMCDRHIDKKELKRKIINKQCYIIQDNKNNIGILRYNLFWDNTPFLTLIYLLEDYRAKEFGKKAIKAWENEMYELGYKATMTSTQADEQAQHFYRKLGYKDCGCLVLDIPEMEQPLEIFFIKSLLDK